MFTIFKNGMTGEFLGAVFKIKCSTFQPSMSRFVAPCSNFLFERIVNKRERKQTMSFSQENDCVFTYYKHARYATDVIFYQSLHPCDSVLETKHYYS